MEQLLKKAEVDLEALRQKHQANMWWLKEENVNLRARLAIHHPPPPPPQYSPSFKAPTHAETRNQENYTQLSFYSN